MQMWCKLDRQCMLAHAFYSRIIPGMRLKHIKNCIPRTIYVTRLPSKEQAPNDMCIRKLFAVPRHYRFGPSHLLVG